MKRIGLISDTHGYIDERITDHFRLCDEIWHAGDIGDLEVVERLAEMAYFRGVHGNIDDAKIRRIYPENLVFELEGIKIWMTHIGGLPPGYNRELKKRIDEIHPDVFVCGHSHIVRIMQDSENGLLYMNPGAAGHQGFHRVRTIIRFSIDNGRINDVQVIELGNRGSGSVG